MLISEELLKDSPVMRQHKRRATHAVNHQVKQFMMNLKSTHQDNEDSALQAEEDKLKSKKQLTMLFTKELDDNSADYFNMDISQFRNLSIEELKVAFSILMKQGNVLFSGSVNTLINRLDYQKVMNGQRQKQKLQKVQHLINQPSHKSLASNSTYNNNQHHHEFNELEQRLSEELKYCREKVENREMIQGIWSTLPSFAQCPESREGASLCQVDDKLYLYGGFSRELFGHMRTYDTQTGKWKLVDQNQEIPRFRYYQTMCHYNKKLYMFGGAGPYVNQIKMRLGLNDLHIFDTQSETWSQASVEGAPNKRYNHAAAMLGSVMIIQGGLFADQRKLLNDFAIFDCDLCRWVPPRVYCNRERIDLQDPLPYDQTAIDQIGYRQMHSMTAIQDNSYYQDKHGKAIWKQRRQFSDEENQSGFNFNEGIYLFGGVNQKGELQNDLWFIEPYYKESAQILTPDTFDYLDKPTLSIYFGNHYLIIYGGRNDNIFKQTQNVALNDLCMFSINTQEWITVANYGQLPVSRWGASIIQSDEQNGKIIMFGGINLKSYCKARIYQLEFIPALQKQVVENGMQKPAAVNKVDYRLQNLFNHLKEKIDLIQELINHKLKQQDEEEQNKKTLLQTPSIRKNTVRKSNSKIQII
eukprot:403359488